MSKRNFYNVQNTVGAQLKFGVREKNLVNLTAKSANNSTDTWTINRQNIGGLIAYITQCHLSDPYKITGVWQENLATPLLVDSW